MKARLQWLALALCVPACAFASGPENQTPCAVRLNPDVTVGESFPQPTIPVLIRQVERIWAATGVRFTWTVRNLRLFRVESVSEAQRAACARRWPRPPP